MVVTSKHDGLLRENERLRVESITPWYLSKKSLFSAGGVVGLVLGIFITSKALN